MHTSSLLSVGNTLDECIKCNICTSYCPVSQVTDKFPGPKYVGPQAERFRELGQEKSPDHSVDYCSGCRVCNEVCPTGVRIAEINARARAQIVADRGLSLRNRLLGRNELLGKLGSFAPDLANFALHNPVSRVLAEKVVGIAQGAPLPRWHSETLNAWLARTASQRLKSERKVVYFHGCAIQYYEPYVAFAAIAVLEHNGYEVIVPPQNCCGLPMLSNGEFEAGEGYHRGNVARLAGFARAGYAIVSTSPSCSLTLKEEAPEMLDKHDEATLVLKNATWDIFEWLREEAEEGRLRTDFHPLREDGRPLVMPYHAPCQYRAHRVGKPSLDVLRLIPGLDLRESQARCCGIAGTYGYKTEKYQIAADVGQDLFDFVLEQGESDFVACDTETCRWQIEKFTSVANRHPIEVLAAAYGLYDLEGRRLL
jgi:glycerol-3-phosphate dehydrogenase subunit C